MDDMTCKVFTDETGAVLAKACASGDAKIKFNMNDTQDGVTYENTYPNDPYADNLYISPFDYPVDKPWYQDIWDFVVDYFNAAWGNPIGQVFIIVACLAAIVGVIKYFVDRASWVDYADDAWDAEDYLEELNEAAAEREHQGNEDYAYDGEYDPR